MIDIKNYELSTTGIDACKGKLVPGIVATWGEIVGDITKQQDLIDWVEGQGYLTEHQPIKTVNHQSLIGEGDIEIEAVVPDYYATKQWVQDQGYLTEHQSLEGYATEDWVEGQDYYAPEIAHNPVEYHDLAEDPEIEIEYQDYEPKTMRLIEPGEDGFVIGRFKKGTDPTLEDVDDIYGYYFGLDDNNNPVAGLYEYAWYEKKGEYLPYERFNKFVTENQLSSYATRSWVQQRGYATQTWVGEQGFASDSDLTALTNRVSALETNYGDAITITNNILGV